MIFEIKDKTGRKIGMSKKSWNHITKKHPYISAHLGEIIETIKKSDKITESVMNENVKYYYKYYKSLKTPYRYVLVIVKYLNDSGFVISAYFEKEIK